MLAPTAAPDTGAAPELTRPPVRAPTRPSAPPGPPTGPGQPAQAQPTPSAPALDAPLPDARPITTPIEPTPTAPPPQPQQPLAPTPPPPADAQPPPAPPRPSEQLTPAIVTLASSADRAGPQTLVIRLDPAGLGHVQVRIEHTPGRPPHVELKVERADTLMTLLQDRPRLDQALDQAGLPPEGRTLQFSLSGNGQPRDDRDPAQPRPPFHTHPGPNPGHHDPGLQRAPLPTRRIRTGIDITA